jgi:hypothetical protein
VTAGVAGSLAPPAPPPALAPLLSLLDITASSFFLLLRIAPRGKKNTFDFL